MSKKRYGVYDPICGFKAYKKKILKIIMKKIKPNLYLSDVIPICAKNNFKIINLNTITNDRINSEPKIGSIKKVNKKIKKIIKYFK